VPDPQEVNQLLRYSHLGIQFVLVFGFFVFVGYWVDQKAQTLPLLTMLGVMVGFAAAFYQLYVGVFGADKGKGGPPPAKG
jgi:hypothetical protein